MGFLVSELDETYKNYATELQWMIIGDHIQTV